MCHWFILNQVLPLCEWSILTMSHKEKLAARSWSQSHLFSVQSALSMLFSARHTCCTHWFYINDLKPLPGQCLVLNTNYLWLINYSLLVHRDMPVYIHLLFLIKSSYNVIDVMTLDLQSAAWSMFAFRFKRLGNDCMTDVGGILWSDARYSLYHLVRDSDMSVGEFMGVKTWLLGSHNCVNEELLMEKPVSY